MVSQSVEGNPQACKGCPGDYQGQSRGVRLANDNRSQAMGSGQTSRR